MEAAASRASESQLIEAKLCLADLKIAQGDTSSAEAIAEELNESWASLTPRLRAKLRLTKGRLLLTKMQARAAFAQMEEALQFLESDDDLSLKIDVLIQISAAARFISEFDISFSAANEALSLAEHLGEKMAVGSALLRKAQALEVLDRVTEAEECAREALVNLKQQQSPMAAAQRLALYRLLESFEQLDEAEEGYRHVLNDPLVVENKFVEVLALTYLGDLVQATGRPREAVALHTRAVEIRRHYGQQLGVATSLRGLGKALFDLGEILLAQEGLAESAELFLREDALPGYASVVLALAQIESSLGNDALAIRLARRARKFLVAMTLSELKTIGRSGVTAIHDADALIRRCSSTA
jgi:tetratricopeptide (TPR) repeat protein